MHWKMSVCITYLVWIVCATSSAWGQASMIGADIADIEVTAPDGTKVLYSVVRDGRDTGQFYYIPTAPRCLSFGLAMNSNQNSLCFGIRPAIRRDPPSYWNSVLCRWR